MTQVVILGSRSARLYHVTGINQTGDEIYLTPKISLVRAELDLWWSVRKGTVIARNYLPVIFGLFTQESSNYCRVEDYQLYETTHFCPPLVDDEDDISLLLRLRLCMYHRLRYLANCASPVDPRQREIKIIRDLWSVVKREEQQLELDQKTHAILDSMTRDFLAWQQDDPPGFAALTNAVLSLDRQTLLDFSVDHRQCIAKWLSSLFGTTNLDSLDRYELAYLLLTAQWNDYCIDLNVLFL